METDTRPLLLEDALHLHMIAQGTYETYEHASIANCVEDALRSWYPSKPRSMVFDDAAYALCSIALTEYKQWRMGLEQD